MVIKCDVSKQIICFTKQRRFCVFALKKYYQPHFFVLLKNLENKDGTEQISRTNISKEWVTTSHLAFLLSRKFLEKEAVAPLLCILFDEEGGMHIYIIRDRKLSIALETYKQVIV